MLCSVFPTIPAVTSDRAEIFPVAHPGSAGVKTEPLRPSRI